MKQYHVYELFDQEGTIVYVGMSTNPKSRFKQHITWQNHKCYSRTDLDIRIESTHSIKHEALKAEGSRKLQLGIEWTEMNWGKVGAIKAQENITCEYCNKSVNKLNYGRWHGPNCKTIHGAIIGDKKGGITTGKLIRPCPYCSRELKGAGGYNIHIKKCKTIRGLHQTENQSLQDPSYLDPYHL